MKTTRRDARERALQALYAYELSGDSAEHVIKTQLRPHFERGDKLFRFAEKLFLRTLAYRDEFDAIVEGHTQNWDLHRIALLDRLVLRLAMTEFLFFDDIPTKVTINEAIEVAKDFSTPRSGQFVNGVLDAVLAQMVDEGRITKKGRGLIDQKAGKKFAGGN